MNYGNRFLNFLIVLILVASCGERKQNTSKVEVIEKAEVTHLPYFNSAILTPEWEKGTHKIPAFSFTNQEGQEVTNETFARQIYVADFFFTICPGICPQLTKNMGLLQDEYQEDSSVMLLSHSVMPWDDTVDKLAVYAEKNQVSLPQWHLVTGDKDEIYDIARSGYFADEDFGKTQEEDNFIHTENFILVDGQGFIRGVYNGTLPLEVKRLMRHIEILKSEL